MHVRPSFRKFPKLVRDQGRGGKTNFLSMYVSTRSLEGSGLPS